MHSKWTVIGCYKLLVFVWKVISLPFRLLFRYLPEFRQVYSAQTEVKENQVTQPKAVRPDSKIKIDKKDIIEVRKDDPKEQCPEFQEIIDINKEMIIGVEKIIRTPDETALIRILNDESYSKQFKKRVYTIKGQKCIKVDGKKYFIEKTKVQLD